MASEVDICNLAIGHLGETAVISAIRPPDGTQLASWCARFYPMARDAILESHNWNFCTTRDVLTPRDLPTLPSEWAFAYAYPSCLKFLGVLPPDIVVGSLTGAIFDPHEFIARAQLRYPYKVEKASDGGQTIYTNIEDATGYFIIREEDTTKYSPLLVIAISRFLASMLAGPVIKGTAGMTVAKAQLEWYEKIDGPRARASNAQVGKDTSYDDFTPSGIAARN